MITVFGSINMDLIATTSRLPEPGETLAGSGFSTAAGGKGANQALAARRAGAEVRMVGATGNDSFREGALALLGESGVDLSQVNTRGEASGIALITVGEDGENTIIVVPGANGEVTQDDAEAAVAAMQASDTLMLQLEIPAPAVEAALNAAREKGVRTLLNTAPLTADAARLAALADIVIANETEFELLVGQSDLSPVEREAAMERHHTKTGQTLIVTLGADGVIAIRDGRFFRASGLQIDPVDTVGAGDTFCGYLAASLDRNPDFTVALQRAATAGSLACLKPGAQPSIPVEAEVDFHLAG